jgi:lysophospholipase L1-like esterase
MYRFQVECHTQWGESVFIVGGSAALGSWDLSKAVPLKAEHYPLWRSDPISVECAGGEGGGGGGRLEYKYVKKGPDGAQWEPGGNRWVPIDSGTRLVVHNKAFGVANEPFSFSEEDDRPRLHPAAQGQLRVVVIGSSVAEGFNAWRKRGWASLLGEALAERYGHELVNVSQSGANTQVTKERFDEKVLPWRPDVVIIALSLGNEGLAHCPPGERRAAQHRYEQGLLDLLKMVVAANASPVLGGVYPNGDYNDDTYQMMKETRRTMQTWGVPTLEWLEALDDGRGRWKDGLAFDHAHPNSEGHRRMFASIDLKIFDTSAGPSGAEADMIRRRSSLNEFNMITRKTSRSSMDAELQESQGEVIKRSRSWHLEGVALDDGNGFSIVIQQGRVSVRNKTEHEYTLCAEWGALSDALASRGLRPGTYVCTDASALSRAVLFVGPDGRLVNKLAVPPSTDALFAPSFPAVRGAGVDM